MVSQLTTPTSNHGSTPGQIDRLRALPAYLAAKIKGQERVLPRVASVLTRGELGFAHPHRPRGSFLFIGPTGVGKTETTKAFTDYLCTGATPITFDMSEFQNQVSVEKLLGENRRDPGLLGRALHGVTRGTLLFDEVEKSHPLVLDLFLQILEEARVTLATGETMDLRHFYIVCTSNIGSAETMHMENAPVASVERTVLMRVREQLRPELVGRITDMLVFARLTYPTQRAICEDMITAECARLRVLGHEIEVAPDAVEFLVRRGYHRTLGARPMRAAVERFLQDAIAAAVLDGNSGSGRVIAEEAHERLIIE